MVKFLDILVSLNPCCNGIYLIIYVMLNVSIKKSKSLNPYCNGIYLIIAYGETFTLSDGRVLILIVMEYT